MLFVSFTYDYCDEQHYMDNMVFESMNPPKSKTDIERLEKGIKLKLATDMQMDVEDTVDMNVTILFFKEM